MYRRKNRKKELARRVAIYVTMTIVLIISLGVLTFHMLGYSFNPNTKVLQQTGLVQYMSQPSGAVVSVDDRQLTRTRTKNTVLPGRHTFSMTLDGYESWQKTLEIKSNTVTNLDYVRLVPKNRSTTTVKELESLQTASLSPAGSYMLGLGQKDSKFLVTVGDLRNTSDEKFTTYNLNNDSLAGSDRSTEGHVFSVTEWDQSNRFAIVKHGYKSAEGADAVQWLRFDLDNPTKLTDIGAAVSLAIKQINFSSTNGEEFYVLQENGELCLLNLSSLTVSRPVVAHVESFKLFGSDRLAYVTSPVGDKKSVGIWKKDWKTPHVLMSVDSAKQPLVRLSHYFHKDTVAIALGDTLTLYRGEISEDTKARQKLAKTAEVFKLDYEIRELSINNGGRIIAVRAGAVANTYDLERRSLSQKLLLAENDKELHWLDDFHLWSVNAAGKMIMQEFDGANRHELLKVDVAFGARLSSNQRYIYAILGPSGKLTLSKMNMVANPTSWWIF